MEKIIFFSPHSAIWEHAFPEALIAEVLNCNDHKITYVTCGNLLNSFCISMNAYGLNEASPIKEKLKICKICNSNKKEIKKTFNFDGFDLSDKITGEIASDIQQEIKKVTVENYSEFHISSIPIGRIAAYEFFINHKKNTSILNDIEFENYLIYLKNCLYVYFIMNEYLTKNEISRVVCYNSLYSINNVVCHLAESRNIKCYSLHRSINWAKPEGHILVSYHPISNVILDAKLSWDKFKNNPITKEIVSCVTDHVLSLAKSTNFAVYSKTKKTDFFDLEKFFNIKPKQKVLVATMSSYDERFAAEFVGILEKPRDSIFESQIEWIQFLVDEVEKDKSLFLIIRVHPREFPNKREGVKAKNAVLLQKVFEHLPENVSVNWPDQNISLYDLIDIADVFLNAWSSVGIEMSALGFPVVIHSADLIWYPSDLNYLVSLKEHYMRTIYQALHDGWSLERVRKTYRWMGLYLEHCSIDITDGFPSDQKIKSNLLNKIKRRIFLLFDRNIKAVNDCKNKNPVLSSNRIINEIIGGGKRSIFSTQDIIYKYKISDQNAASESFFINESLSKICDHLYKNEEIKMKSKLYKNIFRILSR